MSGIAAGRASVDRLVAGVEQASRNTAANLEQVAGAEAMSRRIDKIVDGIVLIAVQTTMLAVSGAVEAARRVTPEAVSPSFPTTFAAWRARQPKARIASKTWCGRSWIRLSRSGEIWKSPWI